MAIRTPSTSLSIIESYILTIQFENFQIFSTIVCKKIYFCLNLFTESEKK
jgi:hypothetical protein